MRPREMDKERGGMIKWYVSGRRWGDDWLRLRWAAVPLIDVLGRPVDRRRELSDVQCCWLIKYGHTLSRATTVYV